MSKHCNETYDATRDAAEFTLNMFDEFYATHPVEDNEEDSVAFYFDEFVEFVVKGWKDREYKRHKYDYNHRIAQHSDKSPATLRRIYNKK